MIPLLPSNAQAVPDRAILLKVMLEPRGKARHRTDRGVAHSDTETREWSEKFGEMTIMNRRRNKEIIESIWNEPIAVALELYYPRPKSKPKWFCTSPVDNDNGEKIVWDACQKLFFKNDNRIIANSTFKAWAPIGERPHVKIRIYPLIEKEP